MLGLMMYCNSFHGEGMGTPIFLSFFQNNLDKHLLRRSGVGLILPCDRGMERIIY